MACLICAGGHPPLVDITVPDQGQYNGKILCIFHHMKSGLAKQLILGSDIVQPDPVGRSLLCSPLKVIVHDQLVTRD
jgi:hypothetical protein